jgi:hypothetical protein
VTVEWQVEEARGESPTDTDGVRLHVSGESDDVLVTRGQDIGGVQVFLAPEGAFELGIELLRAAAGRGVKLRSRS